jgi:mono/diheme cytochrome c family protein
MESTLNIRAAGPSDAEAISFMIIRALRETNAQDYVRHPKGQMPPYTQAVLSDSDLAAVYDYLKSLPQPPAQLPKLLSGASGIAR